MTDQEPASNTDNIRLRILSFGGREFIARELPRHVNLHGALLKMEKAGEIKITRLETPDGGKPFKVYQEIQVKLGRRAPCKKTSHTDEVWSKVWPEFFVAPAFESAHRTVVNKWGEHSIGE